MPLNSDELSRRLQKLRKRLKNFSPNPTVDESICRAREMCGTEMKWVMDEGDGSLTCLLDGINKLVAERVYILLFPMCEWDSLGRPLDERKFGKHLNEHSKTNPVSRRPFNFHVIRKGAFETRFGRTYDDIFV